MYKDKDKCPECGSEDLIYDLVEESDGSKHDVIDCNSCKEEVYYEEY